MAKTQDSFRHDITKINNLLAQDKFVCNFESKQLLQEINQNLPQKFHHKLFLLLKPATFFAYLKLLKIKKKFSENRKLHNQVFIKKELERREGFFSQATKFPLDNQQREAVVSNEDNCLVIAGAGSGKTLTIVGKIKYLIEFLGVQPNEILPISFTHKSAEEMKHRINIDGVFPQTFHKFGLGILQKISENPPNIFQAENEDAMFKEFLNQAINEDEGFLNKLNTFLIYYLKIPKSQFEFKSLGEYIQYLKDQNFTTLKMVDDKYARKFHKRKTLKNEVIKSIEECQIANFLTINQITYQYEKPYARGDLKRSYKPDFTITMTDGSEIYLEHFGINRNKEVPNFFAKTNETRAEASQRYNNSISWKRILHHKNSTTLIETFSYEMTEGSLFKNLELSLKKAGVQLNPMTPLEQWNLINSNSRDQVDIFISLLKNFLALFKSNNYSIEAVIKINNQHRQESFLYKRAKLFLELFEVIYKKYQSKLAEENAIDFNDMIIQAAEKVANGQIKIDYKYIIIDEFQYLSFGRYKILEAIRKQNPAVKFFCVGDDWQSIFRFTGSDITLFADFEKFFGETYISRIETTYRFNNPLISLSSDFILKNPNQLPKSIVAAPKKSPTTYQIFESTVDNDDSQALLEALVNFEEQGMNEKSKVYIIGRYSFDINRIFSVPKKLEVNYSTGRLRYFSQTLESNQIIEMNFITAHKSKGLEADFVVVINCNSGKFGFPSGKTDDPILSLVLSSGDQFEDGEERRLFYVAMTRAKKSLALITNKYHKSKFIKELELANNAHKYTLCPRCGNGEIVKRTGLYSEFYGCTNWEYGCDFTSKHPLRNINQ